VAKVPKDSKKPKLARKKQLTVRERTQLGASTDKTKQIRSVAGKATTPLRKVAVPFKKLQPKKSNKPSRINKLVPENRFGRILRKVFKRRSLIPGWLKNSWAEIRQVTWPTYRETARLTLAVFIFSVVFALIVGILDFVLDKALREVVLG
jgi:preprotein translocase subunit SecE